MNGQKLKIHSVSDAIKHKIAYVSEDRKKYGIVQLLNIKENITLANLKKITRRISVNDNLQRQAADSSVDALRIKCAGILQRTGNLSGGNQQKVLLAKWMFAEPEIMILDEPTRGIDVGAKYEIYCIINDLVAAGKSVVMISSEMPEVLGMCDRIYVMSQGKLVGEMDARDATQERIMSSILSVNKGA